MSKKYIKGEDIGNHEMMEKYGYSKSMFVGWNEKEHRLGIIIKPEADLNEINLVCSQIIQQNCIKLLEYQTQLKSERKRI